MFAIIVPITATFDPKTSDNDLFIMNMDDLCLYTLQLPHNEMGMQINDTNNENNSKMSPVGSSLK